MAVILPVGWSDFEIQECCVDSTLRGQALVVEELAFNQQATVNASGTRRTSWAYVSPEGEVITIIGDANCGGGSMPYQQLGSPPDPNCVQLNRFTLGNPTVFDHPTPIDLAGGGLAVNTVVGSSDEPLYVFQSAGVTQTSGYYPNTNTHVIYRDPLLESVHLNATTFAKKGNRFYGFCGSGGAALRHIIVYNAQASGPEIDNWASLANFNVDCANATATRLVCLCRDVTTNAPSLKKLSLTDGAIMESIDLNDISPKRIFAVNDSLVYIASNQAMYYHDGTSLVFVGRLAGPTFSAFGGNGFFSNGIFYYGQTGFGDGNSNIFKVVIACPEGGPLIANISTGTTVAHGAAINVSWDGILDPTPSDLIALRPAPVGGALGFTGAALATLSTSGPAPSGTLAFNIPGITAPGNYIFQLTRGGSILIATSNVFAVT